MRSTKLTKKQQSEFRSIIGEKLKDYLLNKSFRLDKLDMMEEEFLVTFSMQLSKKRSKLRILG